MDPSKIKGLTEKEITHAVDAVLSKEKKKGWTVEVTFVCDRRMKGLNNRYRGKDKTTDVLSFSMGEEGILGDVLISRKQASQNAVKYGYTLKQELFRLLVHGVLHLLGYDHGRQMFAKQEKYLESLGGN
ncbi:MAG: rRNA maturation RNase YbeY [Candidatus Saganbacteria bacterium]|nr:rRNA maturation RNase YbeY [Candidatus Saganbacteria bacterium]